MDPQCDGCGAFEEDGKPCSHCPKLICNRCRAHHEEICEQNEKRKKRGLGPTVRSRVMSPAPLEVLTTAEMTVRLIELDQPIEPRSDVDQGLAGITELLQD